MRSNKVWSSQLNHLDRFCMLKLTYLHFGLLFFRGTKTLVLTSVYISSIFSKDDEDKYLQNMLEMKCPYRTSSSLVLLTNRNAF